VKIRFEITTADMVAFNRFHCENSPMWRRQRLALSLVLPTVLGCVFLIALMGLFDGENELPAYAAFLIGLAAVFLFVSVGWFFLIRWWMSANVESTVKKLLAEGTNRSILGWRDMELANNRLFVRLELIDSSYDLRAIEKIVWNEVYTFVYVSATQALLVPMHLYPEDEYRAFVDELYDAWENREAPRPSEHIPAADARIAEKRL
jgi:hypothetical protein